MSGTMAQSSVSGPQTSAYDDHTHSHYDVTQGQLTLFVACLLSLALWAVRQSRAGHDPSGTKQPAPDVELGEVSKEGSGPKPPSPSLSARTVAANDSKHGDDIDVRKNDVKAKVTSPSLPPIPTLDETLLNVMLFGVIMAFFYLCDYRKVLPLLPRIYDRDQFLFFVFLLFLVGCAFTITPTKDVILNRDQTEEWKGWMQVMFVWYHYFAAKEWYNWIRVYIACYVWMTGFGNFSFFWVKGDYSLWRVLKMLFRMNFLVMAVVMVTNNYYMLYYICAMHTYWFLTVYLFMRCFTSWNTHRWKMAFKFLVYIACNAVIFEVPGMCSTLFRPLWFIFQFPDNTRNIMHEWEFRAGLDHWACLAGMLCAYNYPNYERWIKFLESGADLGTTSCSLKKLGIKVGMLAAAVAAGVAWYFCFMRVDKYTYNATHCYTSILPILIYILVRNLFPVLRRYYVGLFAFLGKITLETYLSQLHIYLQSNAKHLLGYLSGYPLLNFALATVIYLTLSRQLFNLTLAFSAFFLQKDIRKAAKLSGAAVGVLAVSYLLGLLVKAYCT